MGLHCSWRYAAVMLSPSLSAGRYDGPPAIPIVSKLYQQHQQPTEPKTSAWDGNTWDFHYLHLPFAWGEGSSSACLQDQHLISCPTNRTHSDADRKDGYVS